MNRFKIVLIGVVYVIGICQGLYEFDYINKNDLRWYLIGNIGRI